MSLTGTETLQVLGQDLTGKPAAETQQTTTQAIANLAGATPGVVTGTGSVTAGHLSVFTGTGYTVQDGGAFGTGAVTAGHLAVFTGTGYTIQDGGVVPVPGALAAPIARTDATALTAANITAYTAAGQNRYVLSSTSGVPVTLPHATGSGTVLQFFMMLNSTSNGYVFSCGTTGDRFESALYNYPAAAGALVQAANAAGNNNRATFLNQGAGTGGGVGDFVQFTDISAGHYLVEGHQLAGTTPFSSF